MPEEDPPDDLLVAVEEVCAVEVFALAAGVVL
jgi:hypothetical protein